MLRHFTIVSDSISYSAGVAEFELPRRTKGSSRCAIIGWDVRAADRQFALQNLLDYLQVGSRQYVQGDSIVLGLFTPAPPGAANNESMGRPYLPGSSVQLPDGTSCGAICVLPGERIQMRLTDLTGNAAPIDQIVLHCVEYPGDCQTREEQQAAESAWDLLRRGIGESLIWGNELAYSAGGVATLEQIPKGPNAQAYRRKEVRGVAHDATGALEEADFGSLLLLVYSQTQVPTTNQGIPARSIAGHGALAIVGAASVDLGNDERAYLQVSHPTPAAARVARFATVYEGRSESGAWLQAARAIS